MPDIPEPTNFRVLGSFEHRGKSPATKSVLDRWVSEASRLPHGIEAGRLAHLISTTVAVAVLQQAVDASGRPFFLLRGGTYLQYRLRSGSRATRDVDGLVRGDLEQFLAELDTTLAQDWGAVSLQRTAAEPIAVPGKLLLPQRFYLKLSIRGEVWRRVKVEISADEADAGSLHEDLIPAHLHYFGLPTPERLLGIGVQYQVAQKLHACTDPHNPPDLRNERARDVADLLLLKSLIEREGFPALGDVLAACVKVFEARAAEAVALGRPARVWPPTVVPHPGWEVDYAAAAAEVGLELALEAAVAQVNAWIDAIASASASPQGS